MSASWESLANDHILGIAPYEPGKPIEELERELGIADVIKLASNENPLPPSERVQRAIIEAIPHLNRYPDGNGYDLREALARRHQVSPDHVILGHESNELIELVVRAFLRPGDEAVIPHPSFLVYPIIVQAVGGIRVVVTLKDHRLDLEHMARAINPMTRIVFIANPNNPTATIVTADEVAAFMARVPDRTIVIFDEAYYEFAEGPDFPDSLAYMREGRKVVTLRTFSKAASLAGLRVGYAIADPDCIALLNRIRPPFNVNSLAQVAALAALGDEAHIRECRGMNEAGRHYLYDELTTLGVKYTPSRANFILVDVGRNAADIFQRLLKEGVIVRPLTSFGMESALRISHRHPQENRRLMKALRKVVGEGRAGGEGKPVIDRLAIVGLGLLGGSVARAARARSLAREIVAVGRDPRRLEPARLDGTVDRVTTDFADGLGAADFCVIATPVATLLDLLPAVFQALPAGAILTDVGSTKARIVAEAERLGQARAVRFIGSHPMAGSEQSGYAVARADLFEGATVIVTPTEHSDPDALARVDALWRALGARMVRLEPGAHDRAVAVISHMPHLVADAVVDAVLRMDPAFLDLAGRGFKDTTRIAASSPPMWREIYLDNRPALIEALDAFRKALDHLESIVGAEDGPALERELDRIKQVRERMP